MPLHKDLTGADLHEMKGAASAAANTVPVANGSGSTAFQKITRNSLDLSDLPDPLVGEARITINSMASSDPYFIIFPRSATLTSISVTHQASFTGDNPTLTLTRMADSASIHSSSFDLNNESAGFVASANISPTNATIAADGVVRIVPSVATDTRTLFVTISYSLVV